MGRKFKNALTGDINGRHIGVIYGTGERYDGLVPHGYIWSVSYDEDNHWKYVWCHRKSIEDGNIVLRPFSFKKVKSVPGIRGCSMKTIVKMIDFITQYILEFEQDDEIHYSMLGEARSPKHKKPKIIRV